VPALEWQFEPGRTYYVGFDHSSAVVTEWKYVIWKTE
jgi:hypothetical protein